MKKIIGIACGILVVLVSCQQVRNKVFEIAAKEVNKQCPMTIDEITRLDSTSYLGKSNTFCYFYTLTGVEEDSTFLANSKSEMEKALPEHLKKTEEMKAYKESGVTMRYIYCSEKTQKELFRIDIPADKY